MKKLYKSHLWKAKTAAAEKTTSWNKRQRPASDKTTEKPVVDVRTDDALAATM